MGAGGIPALYAEQRAAHDSEARIRLIAGGERAGKSRSAAMELAGRFLEGQLYWLVGPDYDLCRPEFAYLIEALEALDAIETLATPNGQSNRMLLRNGTVIATRTAQRAMRLAGQAPDGILGCEAAQLSYEAFLRLSGRLAERRGWLWLSGTFEGSRGWYAERFRAWQTDNPEEAASFSVPSWANRTLFPGGRADPEIRRLETTYPSDLFQERFGGVPCPPVSLVFREFEPAAHVRTIRDPYESFDNIEIAVDPGYAGAYAVLAVAQRGPEVFVLDEVYMQYAMTSQVIEACQRRSWWPHVRSGVIDIAGRQHHAMPSQIEVWMAQARIRLRSHRVLLQDGMERLRTFLRNPGTGEAANHGEFAVPGADPGVCELPLPRAAGTSPGLGTADRRGQSRDQGAVLLAVRPVWGGAAKRAAAVDSVSDYVVMGFSRRARKSWPG